MHHLQGIPTLVIISPEGVVLTEWGRNAVEGDPMGKKFPWANTAGPEARAFVVQARHHLLVRCPPGRSRV